MTATTQPSRGRAPSRVLGAAGILGGTALLAAFVLEIPSGLNDVRLALFNIGAIAVVVAVHQRQVAASPNLARPVAIAAIAANLMYLMRAVVLPNGPWHPFAGDSGWVLFYSGLAMWLADAAFGFVTVRLGAVTRLGALALTIGSVLAILGMDRLELTSQANPTIFGPISLIGIALNGIAWILLGLDSMRGGSPTGKLRSALTR